MYVSASHGHPWLAPDEIEDVAGGAAFGPLADAFVHRSERVTQPLGLALASERRADQTVEVEVVTGRARMRDDDMVNELAQRVRRLERVLVNIDDCVRRRERADPVEQHVLRPPDLGDVPHRLPRMDAEAGASDELVGQPEVAHAAR